MNEIGLDAEVELQEKAQHFEVFKECHRFLDETFGHSVAPLLTRMTSLVSALAAAKEENLRLEDKLKTLGVELQAKVQHFEVFKAQARRAEAERNVVQARERRLRVATGELVAVLDTNGWRARREHYPVLDRTVDALRIAFEEAPPGLAEDAEWAKVTQAQWDAAQKRIKELELQLREPGYVDALREAHAGVADLLDSPGPANDPKGEHDFRQVEALPSWVRWTLSNRERSAEALRQDLEKSLWREGLLKDAAQLAVVPVAAIYWNEVFQPGQLSRSARAMLERAHDALLDALLATTRGSRSPSPVAEVLSLARRPLQAVDNPKGTG